MKKSLVLLLLLLCFGIAWGQNGTLFVGKVSNESSLSAPGFPVLQEHFHKYVDNGTLAGVSMLVSKGDQIAWDFYGMQNIETDKPMAKNTIFRLASMTKPIVSVAVMILVEEGKLHLDDKVEQFIPTFKKLRVYESEDNWVKPQSAVTIRQLLSHTGGLTSGFDSSPAGKLSNKLFKEKRPASLKDIVEIHSEIPLAFHPGKGWAYSYSTDVLAYIVEQISGEPIDRFLAKRIFEPLKMKDTGFYVPKEKMDRFASLYAKGDDGKLAAIDKPENSPYTDGTYFPRGNGGLTSTMMDYYQFAKMLLNGGTHEGVRILKKETVELMTTNLLPPEHLPIKLAGNEIPGYGFGLGFGVLVGDPPFGSNGDYFWPGAAFTYFFINPEEEIIGLFMTQLSDMTKMHLIGEFHGLASRVFLSGSD